MARRFTRSAGRVGKDRLTAWFTFPPVRTTLAAASVAVIQTSLNAAALALRPFTIVRSRFHMHVRSDTLAALEDYSACFGIAVVSDQAVAIGVTAVPTPDADRGSGLWFVYEELYGTIGFVSGTGVRDIGSQKDVDSKAMRKVDIGQDVVTVIEATAISLGCVVTVGGRMLIKTN